MRISDFDCSFLRSYSHIVLDFDGTLVDSIPAKNAALQTAVSRVLPLTSEIVEYISATTHLTRIERLKGIMMIADETSPQSLEDARLALDKALCGVYDQVQKSAQLISFIQTAQASSKIYIVSAAPEDDLNLWISRNLLSEKIDQVSGAPRDKSVALSEITFRVARPDTAGIIYVGDTEYDRELAMRNNIDFMWSEFCMADRVSNARKG